MVPLGIWSDWLESARNPLGIWSEWDPSGSKWFGRNLVGIWSEYSESEWNLGGLSLTCHSYHSYHSDRIPLGFRSEFGRNDSESKWNLGGFSFLPNSDHSYHSARIPLGFLPFRSESARIHSESYHSARIRSECVGEGKVLQKIYMRLLQCYDVIVLVF